jgi:hypothetical protein
MVHSRLEIEREKQRNWREKSAIGGKKSGEKRKKNGKSKGGSRVVEPNGNSSSSFSSSSSSSLKQKNKQTTHSPAALCVYEFYKDKIKASTRKGDSLKWIERRIEELGAHKLVMSVARYMLHCKSKQVEEKFKKDAANFFGEDAAFEAFLPDEQFFQANLQKARIIMGEIENEAE